VVGFCERGNKPLAYAKNFMTSWWLLASHKQPLELALFCVCVCVCEWVSEWVSERMGIGFIWLRMGPVVGCCEHREFLDHLSHCTEEGLCFVELACFVYVSVHACVHTCAMMVHWINWLAICSGQSGIRSTIPCWMALGCTKLLYNECKVFFAWG
jgi:hypothetical protein